MRIGRRGALCLIASFLCALPAAASDFSYGQTLSFTATRNGQSIGTHRLTFSGDDGRRAVVTDIDLAVRLAGIVVYRYSHRSEEVWSGGKLQSLSSKTDDNGKQHAVRASRSGGGVMVERETREAAGLLRGGADQTGLQAPSIERETMPAEIVPTSHWNIRQVKQSELLNSQLGVRSRVTIAEIGREQVRTSGRTVEATRYRYSGDVKLDQWFDRRGRWVKMTFPASDGSTIEYTLQE